MEKREIINAIKVSAFDAILKASRAKDSYFKRAEAIFDIIEEANRLIGKARENG